MSSLKRSAMFLACLTTTAVVAFLTGALVSILQVLVSLVIGSTVYTFVSIFTLKDEILTRPSGTDRLIRAAPILVKLLLALIVGGRSLTIKLF